MTDCVEAMLKEFPIKFGNKDNVSSLATTEMFAQDSSKKLNGSVNCSTSLLQKVCLL